MTPQPSIREPGTLLAGKYRLEEQLGAGGMGVVFRAEQLALARPVAIKFLHHVLSRDPRIAARFQAEAQAAASLGHPNSVAVVDYGEAEDGTPYLVMEYVRGRTLRQIAADGPVAVERVIAICLQILAALGEAHAAGIVHADVKTENILVEARHDGERVKLVDFGLACVGRAFDDDRSDERNESGEEPCVSGTADYMAPEIILGGYPSPASDIYAVGVVLYELLTGSTPFGGGAPIDIFARHVRDDLIPPSLRFPDLGITRALEAVIARALDKDPARRYPDSAAFAAALSAIELEPTVPARPSPHQTTGGDDLTMSTRRLTRDESPPPPSRFPRGSEPPPLEARLVDGAARHG